MIRPRKVNPGDLVLAEHHNEVVDAILERTPLSFARGLISKLPHGFHLSGRTVGSSSSPTHPLKLLDASEGETIKARILYGTIAGAAPSGMSLGDDPPYILTLTGEEGIIWAGITRDVGTGAITSRFFDHGVELPEDTESDGHIQIGSFVVTDGVLALAQAVSGSQAHQYCGDAHLWGLI